MLKTTIGLAFYATACAAGLAGLAANAQGTLHDERETRLSDVRQLTFGAENAEAYWSPDGRQLAFGSNRNQGQPGETDVYLARWNASPAE